jgi:hypothetical protein
MIDDKLAQARWRLSKDSLVSSIQRAEYVLRLISGGNHQALMNAGDVAKELRQRLYDHDSLPADGCECDREVTGPVPNYCRIHDGDYSSWLASNNID